MVRGSSVDGTRAASARLPVSRADEPVADRTTTRDSTMKRPRLRIRESSDCVRVPDSDSSRGAVVQWEIVCIFQYLRRGLPGLSYGARVNERASFPRGGAGRGSVWS